MPDPILPKWPKDQSYLSIKDAAELLEPFLPPPPLLERHKAIVERERAPDELTEDERKRLMKSANINGDFETFFRLRDLGKRADNDDPYEDITRTVRQASHLPHAMLAAARTLGLKLIHHTLGINYDADPTIEWFVDEDGFYKIARMLLTPKPGCEEEARPVDENARVVRNAPESPTRKRRQYEPALNKWLLAQHLSDLQRLGADVSARNFETYCREERPDIAPLLPERWRVIAPAIERHIGERVKRAKRLKPVKRQ